MKKMMFSLFDFSNTHIFHRKALVSALDYINQNASSSVSVLIVVGTRNVIKFLPQYFSSNSKYILIFTGFGRLFTNYGFLGKFIFSLIVRSFSSGKVLAFIVENSDDALFLRGISNIRVFQTSGSGLDRSGFRLHKKRVSHKVKLGYLSRFDRSKGSQEVLKIAKGLPDSCELHIAGWDVTGKKFSTLFSKIASEKSNIDFLGRLNKREEVSDFFNKIDVFLCPSLREGGCISIQEAAWHFVPFMTTNVPGCKQLAEQFECPAYEFDNFAGQVLQNCLALEEFDTGNWRAKLRSFSEESVREEYIEIFKEVLLVQESDNSQKTDYSGNAKPD